MSLAVWVVALELIWIVGIAIWVVLEKRSPTSTIAWTLALVFLPAIGIPIYLLVAFLDRGPVYFPVESHTLNVAMLVVEVGIAGCILYISLRSKRSLLKTANKVGFRSLTDVRYQRVLAREYRTYGRINHVVP